MMGLREIIEANRDPHNEEVIQLYSSYFTAGIILQNGTVTEAAPIIRYMKGWNKERVLSYAGGKGWKMEPAPSKDFVKSPTKS